MKDDIEVLNSKEFSKQANDFLKLQLSRLNDITQLKKQLTRLNQNQLNAIIKELSLLEEKRLIQEEEILKQLFQNNQKINENKLKTIQILCRKLINFNTEAIENEILWLIKNKISSQIQCLTIMQDSKVQNNVFNIQDESDILKQQLYQYSGLLRDKFLLLIQQAEKEKNNNEFYQLDFDQLLFKAQDAIDTIALSQHIQQQAYKTLLKHNQSIKLEIQNYKLQKPNKQQKEKPKQVQVNNETVKQVNKQVENNDQRKKGFKGLETLQMLEQALGLQQKTTLDSIKSTTQKNKTNQYNKQQILALSESSGNLNQTLNLSTIQSNDGKQAKQENEFYRIQEQYLSQLENSYKNLQKLKQAKKFQIIRSIKLLQRFWRFRYRLKRKIAANKIGRYYKQYKQKLINNVNQLYLLKKKLSIMKIQRFMKLYLKKQRIALLNIQVNDITYYQRYKKQIIKLQKMIRSKINRKHYNIVKEVRKQRILRNLELSFKQQSKRQLGISKIHSQIVKQTIDNTLKEQYFQDYYRQSVLKFESDWVQYEKKLTKYLQNFNNFKDWAPQQNKYGQKYWLNTKTLQETQQHPSVQYIEVNLKSMRKKAEEKFRTDVIEKLEEQRSRNIANFQNMMKALNEQVRVKLIMDYLNYITDKVGDMTISVLDELKFWGEVVVEFLEIDKTSSDSAVDEFRKELREQMKEQKECDKLIEEMRKEQEEDIDDISDNQENDEERLNDNTNL